MAKTMKTTPMRASVAAARQESMAAAAPVTNTLLRGNKFYLSRSIPVERRRELRVLIQVLLNHRRRARIVSTSNGGILMQTVTPDAVELVENDALQNGKDWVSADFVYDSVRDQTMQDLRNYMAREHRPSPQQKSALMVDQPKRKGRVEYAVADDAKMFQFLENYRGKVKSMATVPLSVWKMAERINVTSHSGESMHEHYRKILKKYTPLERRNAMQNAQAEENTRQRRELAAINAKVASRTAPTTSATFGASKPVNELTSTADGSSVNPQVSESQISTEPRVLDARTAPTPETKRSAPVADNDEAEEEEDIQGRGKKRGRKSASADQQKVVVSESPSKEAAHEDAGAHVNEPQSPSVAAEAAAATTQPERVDDSTALNTSAKTPVVSSKKQQKQKLKQTKPAAAPPFEDEEDESAEVGTEETSDSLVAKENTGYYFRSRWEQLISDTGNRQHLQQFFSLNRQRDVARAPALAAVSARGNACRKAVSALSAAVRSSPSPASIATANIVNNDDKTGSSAPATLTRQRKRVALATMEEERKQEEEDEGNVAPKPPVVALKKRKVRQAPPPPPAPVPAAVTLRQAPAQTSQQQGRDEREEQVVVLVTSETEVDELTCQLQFQTNQELNAIVHALYYSSGDVDVALRFLCGASVSGDFWSLEDDLLLGDDLVDEATDDRKVVEARRLGAFERMRVQRTTAQILTRIRYLL